MRTLVILFLLSVASTLPASAQESTPPADTLPAPLSHELDIFARDVTIAQLQAAIAEREAALASLQLSGRLADLERRARELLKPAPELLFDYRSKTFVPPSTPPPPDPRQ